MTTKPTHLLHIFPTFAVGGSQMRFAQLARAHASRFRHTVVALDSVTDMASLLPLDADTNYLQLHFDKGALFSNLKLFRETIQKIAPDVLITYNWGAIEWALANRLGPRRKHVHIEDGFATDEALQQIRRRIWMRRLALSGHHTTIVLPSRGLEKIALRVWRLSPQRVRYVPNGIDCQRYFVDVQSRKGKSPPYVIGTLATLRSEKNILRLIRAFDAIVKERSAGSVELLIVGDGPERAALETAARRTEHSSLISFAGATRQPELWYPKMDIFALSSDTEQMPFSVLEAMAAGLPVVSPAVGDIASLVAPDNAPLIVSPTDENAFRNALIALLDDETKRMQLGLENQRRARREFDETLMANRYAELFG